MGEVIDVAPLHQPDEHCLVAVDDGRHAEDGIAVDRLGVLRRDGLERTAGGHLLGNRVRVEADTGGRFPQDGLLGDLLSVVVAGRERRHVEVEEVLGEGVTDGDTPQQGPETGDALLVEAPLPDGGLALFHVDLVERERPEPDVPVAAFLQAGDEGLVGVAGEGAAVVPGDGKLTSQRSLPTDDGIPQREQPPPVYPAFPGATSRGGGARRRAASPNASPRAAPPTTSEVWWRRT